MNEADADFELRRMFLGFGGAIALCVILYAWHTLKIYLLGKRVRAVVAKVVKKEDDPPGSGPKFSYVLEYSSPDGERRLVHERQELRVQEFKIGDTVTAFVQNDRIAEILSWRRLAIGFAVIAFTSGAMIAGYYVLLGKKG